MRNDWSAIALMVCASFGASAAHAGSTADDLAQIEAQHVVLKARLRVLETQAQMAARQAEIERHGPVAEGTMPTLGGVEGVGDKLYATVYLENGYVAEVRTGDMLPNGMRVLSIRPDNVLVQRSDKTRVRLKPAGEPPRSAAPTFSAAGPASLPFADAPRPTMPAAEKPLPAGAPMPGRAGAAR
jgi:type IV pilus biogenesis protein PilP